jgi:hypothetical protein
LQESISACVYGGLSHHGLSRLSAASSTVGVDYDDAVLGVPIFDERVRKLEEKDSSGDLFSTPPNIPETPPNFASSTSSIPGVSGY